jgi:hypothetical protein
MGGKTKLDKRQQLGTGLLDSPRVRDIERRLRRLEIFQCVLMGASAIIALICIVW